MYSVRKEIKIRPGFTPQEDVSRFRGKRQVQMDQNTLPKGHILGWVAPSSASKPKPAEAGGSASKSAKKNEKRKEKRDRKKDQIIRDNWEDEDVVKDDDGAPNWAETAKVQETKAEAKGNDQKMEGEVAYQPGTEDLGRQLEQLDIR